MNAVSPPPFTLSITVTRHPDPLHEITGIPETEGQINEISGEWECPTIWVVADTLQWALVALRARLRDGGGRGMKTQGLTWAHIQELEAEVGKLREQLAQANERASDADADWHSCYEALKDAEAEVERLRVRLRTIVTEWQLRCAALDNGEKP